MKKIYVFLVLLTATIAWASTNNLPQVTGRVILLDHVNQPRTALSGVLVPRSTLGTVGDVAADLGSSSNRWNNLYVAFVNFISYSGGNAVTIVAPSPVATAYTITLPTATPTATYPVSMSSAGALTVVPITATEISANTITQSQVSTSFINTGTYTPTVNSSVNCSAAGGVSNSGYWLRVGNIVTTSGALTFTCNVSSDASINFQIPISGSNFSSNTQAYGTAVSITGVGALRVSGAIISASGGIQVQVLFFTNTGAANQFAYHYTYQIQ